MNTGSPSFARCIAATPAGSNPLPPRRYTPEVGVETPQLPVLGLATGAGRLRFCLRLSDCLSVLNLQLTATFFALWRRHRDLEHSVVRVCRRSFCVDTFR